MRVCSFIPLVMAVIFTPLVSVYFPLAKAQVMTSSNYQIQSDSVNVSGGLSSSSNYSIESTTGEVGTGSSESTAYKLRAGYQQMQEVYIAMSVASSSLTLSPSIPGVTGGSSYGSTSVSVTTDSLSGYQLTIEAVGNPAMQKGSDTIADYVPSGGNPDFLFSTGASDAHFGYTPEGTDVVQRFLDDGGACNSSSGEIASRCWDGLSTSPKIIAQSSGANHPSGTLTSIRFQVGIGGSVVQAEGLYHATTTVTALPL